LSQGDLLHFALPAYLISCGEESVVGTALLFRQDTFTRAAPVTGGIGKVLLERMGWRAGTGLGKHNAGITVPLAVDIKTDRRG